MNENKSPELETNFWKSMVPALRNYIFFAALVGSVMAFANHMGWFPTYGIFSGENSMHSSHRSGGYHGSYGIHGK